MTTKRPDYAEARNYYIKGEKNEYPTLQDIATIRITMKIIQLSGFNSKA